MDETPAKMTDKPKSTSLPLDQLEKIQTQANRSDGDSDQIKLERLSGELREVTVLHHIGVALNSSLNPKEVIWTLYKETNRLVDTSNFALMLYDYQHKALKFMLVFDQGQQVKPFSTELSDNPGLTGYVLTAQSPLLVRNLADSDKKFELNYLDPDKQIHSWLGVPIVNPVQADQSVQGVIALWSYEQNAFNNHQVWLLSAIGTHASIAIRNARLFESSQRRAAEMAHLNELASKRAEEMAQLKDMAQRKAEEMALINGVARILSASLNLDTVLTKIMEQVDDVLAVEAGSLLLTDLATGDLVFQIALGPNAAAVKPFRLPKGQGIAGRVAQTGKPLVIADAGRDQRHFKAPDEKTNFTTRDILCVPLILHEQVIGVLEVMNKKVGDFNQSDVDLLNSIASYAAIAIDNARLYESLEAEHTRTIIAEQDARKKLASDLHDGPTQLVAAIMMNLDFATKALEKDPSLLPNTIIEMQELAGQASHQMRTLLFQLRPLVLEKQGLGAALQVFLDRRQKEIVEDQNTRISLKIETDDPSGDISRQDGKIETTIFNFMREAVNNSIKHAKADNIIVELKETPEGVHTIIADDGVGFDVDEVMRNYETRGSLGMINLRERSQSIGGEFSLKSQIGQGTRIALFVPDEKAEKTAQKNAPVPAF
jgi:signal transduction histidine kinase